MDYFLLSGHRVFINWMYLGWLRLPCVMRKTYLFVLCLVFYSFFFVMRLAGKKYKIIIKVWTFDWLFGWRCFSSFVGLLVCFFGVLFPFFWLVFCFSFCHFFPPKQLASCLKFPTEIFCSLCWNTTLTSLKESCR